MNHTSFFPKSLWRMSALSLVATLTVTSCKDLTELQPADAFSEATAFTSAARVELAAVGMYNAAQSGNYAGNVVRGYPFGAASIEQGDMRGEDMLNQALFYQITNESIYTPATANNVWMWNTLFALVNQCNILIEGARGAATNKLITDEQAKAYEGEGRFMRALAYHELLINFSRPFAEGNGSSPGMPIRDFAVNSPATVEKGLATGRSSVADTYKFILADLDYAETNLPATRTGNLRVSRAVKGAAIALKTRVKLHQGDWAGVIAEGNKIVSAAAPFTSPIGGYALTAAPNGPFTNGYSSEAVFSIENSAQDNPGVNGALAAMLGNPANGGRGLVRISPIAYNLAEWPLNDLRRTTLLNRDARSYYSQKYTDYTNRSDNAPIIRYAEVLLNLSEAIARTTTGVDARALALLSAVRNRAVVDEKDRYTAASFADNKAFIRAILAERRIEFLGEGRRWADIHRLAKDPDFSVGGIPAKMAFGNATFATYTGNPATPLSKTILAIPYSDYRFLWPIPADETAQNPTLAAQQNPGY
jgi:hypothetical protein